MSGRLNVMRDRMDLSWIKAHLTDALININEVAGKIVYDIDQYGNVIFHHDVMIYDNVENKWDIKVLFETVEELKKQINIQNVNSLDFSGDIAHLREQLDLLEDKILGLYRDDLNAITHITDATEFHNEITMKANNVMNASIIGNTADIKQIVTIIDNIFFFIIRSFKISLLSYNYTI